MIRENEMVQHFSFLCGVMSSFASDLMIQPTEWSMCITVHHLQWRTQKIFMGSFTQWHMVVICIWCALFVTSQFDVIFMFPNQRFGEVCWHDRHILLRALALFYASVYWI